MAVDEPAAGAAVAPEDVLAAVPDLERLHLKRAVAKLHTNLGHPGNAALARAVRLSGGSDAAIAAATMHHCPTCLRLQEPPPAMPASLRDKWREFNDCVAIDLFTLTDARGVQQQFLNMVDMASRYQLVTPIAGKSP
eukprot:9843243-Lingulodinium_polyedra.AAC.1